ncbi:MAG: S1 family peptidase [Lachnospiraceae bacterium]|nr:S1 family peptidase [Lachnospiraceae bacterium]
MKKSFYSKIRKITSAFIAATISMSLMTVAPASAEFGQYDSTVENIETVTDNIFEIQRRACEAHELLYSSFGWNETYIYPDNFAGDYIDYDTLHVQVTDEKAIDYYKDLLSEYSDAVVYDIVDYSYNELFGETENFVASIDEDYGVVSFGVDVTQNKGLVNVIATDYEALTLNIKKSKQNISEKLIIKPQKNYIQSTAISLVAGSPISYNGGNFTLGGSGTYNGNTAFVSCGHAVVKGGTVKSGGTAIGTVAVKQYANRQYGDYSIITANSDYTTTSRVFTANGNVTNFRGYLNNPAVGTYVYRYGNATGQAYCEITRTDLIFLADNTYYIYGITEAELITGTDAKGNSGGPVRNDNYFCGVQLGDDDVNNPTYIYFTPYVYINNAGFQIAT